MPDMAALLAAEAARREPPAHPPFDELLRRHQRRTWRRRGLGAVAVAAAALAAGITLPGVLGTASQPGRTPGGPPPTSEVTGQLVEVGGPPPGAPRGVAGTVRFSGHGRTVSVATGADGHFAVALAAGTYTVTGTSPLYGDGHYQCQADGPLVVPDPGATPRLGPLGVTVACQLR